MLRPLLIVLAACPLFKAGWSLTSSNDSLNSSTDSPSSPNDYLSSPIDSLASPNDSLNLSNDSLSSSKDSLTLSNDGWDQLQPTLMTLSAGKRGIDNEWIDRFPYLDPCHSVGYNRRCSCGQSLTCEGQNTFLYCGLGEVLDIQSAIYGRHNTKMCSQNRPLSQISNTNCGIHSSKVAEICNGKRNCSIRANNNMFGDPCVGTYKYLTVTYSCQRQSVTCEGRAARLTCGLGKALTIITAVYGRQNTKTCTVGRPWSQISNTKCATCTTSKVAEICGGRETCSFQASNSLFGDPCFGTYKYLTVTYTCD